jgi:hypothetical protein
MLCRVALVITDVSEERVTASVVPSSPFLVTLMKEALSSSATSALSRSTMRNIPEDAILHSHRREDLGNVHGEVTPARTSEIAIDFRFPFFNLCAWTRVQISPLPGLEVGAERICEPLPCRGLWQAYL